jgi:hypothetical protein
MAEVTGSFGSEQIQLNNAATEATLKQLVTAVGILAAKSGGGKSQQDIENELKKFHKQLVSGEKQLKKLNAEEKKATKASQDQTKAAEQQLTTSEKWQKGTGMALKGVDKFSSALQGSVTKITSMVNSISNMGTSFASAGSVFGELPLVGGLLGPVFSAIGAAGDKVYNSFQQVGSVGANFGGSMTAMINAASAAGMTIDQFSALIAKNGDNLRYLGAGTSEGAKRLSQLGKSMRKDFLPLQNQLADLGYNTEDINNGFARYAGMMAKSGGLQGMSNKQLIAQTGQYLKNLDAVSKLTGKSKEALQAEEDARRRDAQYRVAERMIRKEDRATLDMFMGSMEDAEKQAFKEMLATGSMAGEASQKLMQASPEVARALLETAQNARNTGKFSQEQAKATDKALNQAAKATVESGRLTVLGAHMSDQFGDQVTAAYDRAGRTTTLDEQIAKQKEEALKKEQERAKGKGDALDPGKFLKMQQDMAVTANEFTKALATQMPQLQSAFAKLQEFVLGPLLTAFKLLMTHLETITKVVAGLAAGMIIFKGIMKGVELVKDIKSLFKGERGSSSGNPLHVTMDDGPGFDLPGKKKKGGRTKRKPSPRTRNKKGFTNAKPKFNPKSLIKPGIGAVVGLGAQYAGEKLAESGHEKAGAGVSVAGSALEYGSMGAMLGTVVPGVGNVVGGAIGAAIGTGVGLYQNWDTLTKQEPPNPKLIENWAWMAYSGKLKDPKGIPEQYRAGVEALLKKPPAHWKAARDKLVPAPIAAPTTATATTSTTKLDAVKKELEAKTVQDQKAVAAKPKTAAELAAEAQKLTAAKPMTPTQDLGGNDMSGLNMKLAEMIKLQRELLTTTQKQLSVHRNATLA